MLCSLVSAQDGTRPPDTSAGWQKYESNPVIPSANYGTIFDVTLLKEGDLYKMWLSWRPKKAIAYTESKDGTTWSELKVVLTPEGHDWADDLNRPGVVKKEDGYHMWYTGQSRGETSKIGYATSKDGLVWEVKSATPVLVFEEPWEKVAVMCPHVEWDEKDKLFKMWYSGGEQYEPNAIGYATSPDGLKWTKRKEPIFSADKDSKWEQHKVTACQIVKHGDWFLMFYIGFENENLARIGIARSKDGITDWQRHPANPIISPTRNRWDADACYKPFVIYDEAEKKWRLWYNGRRGGSEQIGMAYHDGEDLGFTDPVVIPANAGTSPSPLPIPSPLRRQGSSETVSASSDRIPASAGTTAQLDPRLRGGDEKKQTILKPENFKHYIDQFNKDDNELFRRAIPNAGSWDFLRENIPFFDYPDKDIERTYYFRWWTFRKHIKKTESGFVITEFLPNVPWAGKENTISCAGGHHFREGRWLHDPQYLNDYAVFWLRGGGAVRSYSFWIADSIWQQYLITGDPALAKELLPDLVKNYEAWEKDRLDPNGLFWQIDDRDGMEMSIGGSGYRVTINSYMCGEADAIRKIAGLSPRDGEMAQQFASKSLRLLSLMRTKLWDDDAKFFKVAPRVQNPDDPLKLADVRELHGFTPWYFDFVIICGVNAGDQKYRVAWEQLTDPQGFYAPFGPTTAEQRHPKFAVSYRGHECQWNGPSWPYATSITLTALSNLIYFEPNVNKPTDAERQKLRAAYNETLQIYAKSHQIQMEDGRVLSWIDENLNPQTGDWISRTRLKTWRNGTWDAGKGGVERGKDYNHSTFCDLVINGLVGFKPTQSDSFRLFPLVPNDIEYFCLDGIKYHGRYVAIVYDKSGERYNIGKGLRVYVDGKVVHADETLPTVPVAVKLD
jgi:predicted GH43/DUF377 family glycosyl hydrolase